MKKLILSLVFVFATGTMMNANTDEVLTEKIIKMNDCDEVYTETRDSVTEATGSEYIGVSAAIAAESACMEENEEFE